MKIKTFILSNSEAIEAAHESNDRLNLPNPAPIPDPEYSEETAWIHFDSITRATTRKLEDGRSVVLALLDDGGSIFIEKTDELVDKLDEMFSSPRAFDPELQGH